MYKYIKANEIDNKYVGNDCVQVMIPFDKALSIFSETDLTFYGRGYKENKVDNSHYIQDERKQKRNELIEFLKQKKLLHSFDEHDIRYHNGEFILEDNFMLPFDNPLFMIKLDGNEMQIKFIKLSSLNEDIVKVMSFDIPVERYNLEQISEIVKSSTKKLKELVFSKTLGRRKK